jgi:hypothetical protein
MDYITNNHNKENGKITMKLKINKGKSNNNRWIKEWFREKEKRMNKVKEKEIKTMRKRKRARDLKNLITN